MRIAGIRPAGALIAVCMAGGLLAALTASAGTVSASTVTASTVSASTAAACTAPSGSTSPLYGANYDYAGASEFHATNVEPLLSKLDPGTLRYPGGTEADYFNWHIAVPTKNPHTYKFTLAKLEKAYQATRATPVFDLNVMAAANRLNTRDQVSMLKAAKAEGLPVRYVEIGNELYGGGAFAKTFTSGVVYGKTVAAYVPVLHRDFPGVRVAADAVMDPSNTRQQRWDSQLLSTATGAGGQSFSAWTSPAHPTLTPSGQAIAMVDAAACGARSSVPITVPHAPALPGGGTTVTGQAFTAPGRATTALLVKLTGSARNVLTGADIPDGARYQQIAGIPTARQSAARALTAGTVSGNDLKLPAYSITLVNTRTGA